MDAHKDDEQTARRWSDFAAIMIMLGGILNVIWGIIALTHSNYFQANGYVVTDLHTWGWIVLFIGLLELVAAWSIWNGGEFGRYFGMVVAMLNAVSALVSINAYPVWGICLFALDILIIYALVTTVANGRSRAGTRVGTSDRPRPVRDTGTVHPRKLQPAESRSGHSYFTDGSNLYRFVGWLTRSGDAGLAALEDCRSLGVLLVTADDLGEAQMRPVAGQRV